MRCAYEATLIDEYKLNLNCYFRFNYKSIYIDYYFNGRASWGGHIETWVEKDPISKTKTLSRSKTRKWQKYIFILWEGTENLGKYEQKPLKNIEDIAINDNEIFFIINYIIGGEGIHISSSPIVRNIYWKNELYYWILILVKYINVDTHTLILDELTNDFHI